MGTDRLSGLFTACPPGLDCEPIYPFNLALSSLIDMVSETKASKVHGQENTGGGGVRKTGVGYEGKKRRHRATAL